MTVIPFIIFLFEIFPNTNIYILHQYFHHNQDEQPILLILMQKTYSQYWHFKAEPTEDILMYIQHILKNGLQLAPSDTSYRLN